jgi:hypothetical protein
VVARALEREHRRALAARDAEILARTDADPELAGLAEHAARRPSPLLDRQEPALSRAVEAAFDLD